jgi:hypothetical protein
VDELKRNASGALDPTAEKAIKNVLSGEKRVAKTIKTLQSVAHLAGFHIEGRIVLRDRETDEIWR